MKKLRVLAARYSLPTLWSAVAAFSMVVVLGFRLGYLVAGYSASEVAAVRGILTYQAILENPLYLPHKVGQFLVHFVSTSPLYMRSVSVVFGLASVFLFYKLVSKWNTQRVAILSTVLFALSSWFLHITRMATPEVILLGTLLFMLTGNWLRITRRRSLALLVLLATVSLAIYIPGMIWFLIACAIWQRKRILKELQHISWPIITLGILGSLVALAPLIYALVKDIDLYRPLLGLPAQWPTPLEFLKNLANVPMAVMFRGSENPESWLGKLPILDLFSLAMFLLGLYASIRRYKLDHVKLFGGILVLGSILVALGGPVTLTLLLPVIYLIIASGIGFLLNEWMIVFPRNPLARGIATSLVSIAVLMAVFYHVSHYFIAWPNAPATKAVYGQQL
jgi:4-amino-4-deoxy-L-arabinose transferase-like glycosyltransferase